MNRKESIKKHAKIRRIARVRAQVMGTASRPRLTVRRTLKHIYAQVIDDSAGKTLVAASDADVKSVAGTTPTVIATEVGRLLAQKAKEKKIEAVVFDRRDKKYHGRVKALAESAREGGLQF